MVELVVDWGGACGGGVWLGTKGWSMWWRGVVRQKGGRLWWRGVARHKGVEHVVEGCGQTERGGACGGGVWLGTQGWSLWWRGVARQKGVEHVVEGCG